MAVPVLHCYADYKWTGPSEPVVRLCAELSARGWRSDLACRRPSAGRENRVRRRAEEAGLTVHEALSPGGWLLPLRFVRDRAALARLVASADYGLVHCHGSWDHLVAGCARRRWPADHVPVLRTDHGARELHSGFLRRRYFGPHMIDHLIVLNDRHAVQAVDRLGLAPECVTTVRGAVDPNEFRPAQPPDGKREELGLRRDDVVIGVVSRVQAHRRFEVLLEAALLVRGRDPRVSIVVCGRGTQRRKLLDRPVRRMGLSRTVLPLGYRRADYKQVLATFDAGLMLVPGSDGSCRAALQMAAMGKPLIVARRGVLPDIVRDGETGVVVADTPDRLAEAILLVADDEERRVRWGRAARERICRRFSPGREAEEVIGVYERLLGGP
jgi:glycosyltransferase involved in cell wall biosynthesis